VSVESWSSRCIIQPVPGTVGSLTRTASSQPKKKNNHYLWTLSERVTTEAIELMNNDSPALTLTTLLAAEWPRWSHEITKFLPLKDVAMFRQTCKLANAIRVDSIAVNKQNGFWSSRYGKDEYEPLQWQILPDINPRAQLVILKCEWHDQGWGNRKGMLSVVQGEFGKAPRDYTPWSSDVVCGIEPAPHGNSIVYMSFCPSPLQSHYSIFVRVGGGGGHSLTVKNLEACQIVGL